MSSIVFDAGALIALERSDPVIWAALRLASARHVDVVVPSAALAQVWRGRRSQARLAAALGVCVLASFDDLAYEVGALCGRTRTSDVVDAQVALVAAGRAEALFTSDPDDLRRLLDACGGRATPIMRC